MTLPLYGAAGIPEAWVVDLLGGRVEVYAEPEGTFYGRCGFHGREETIDAVSVSGLSVRVSSILG